VEARAREFRHHRVREWLKSLKWDGEERLSTWLQAYLGAGGSELYLRAISRMFLISMVARIFRPGCKCDYMLVLEGAQGVEKSKACEVLAGEEWFTDDLSDISHKDSKLHLRGKWLVEIAELAAFTKAETEALKAFITRKTEKYRPPWGKKDVNEPRQCVFIGTTNTSAYIKDETGGRRFWPVVCGQIDIAKLVADRGQLFAEAVVLYHRGEPWWPDPSFELAHFKPEQDLRIEGDSWEEAIVKFLDDPVFPVSRVTVTELAKKALGFAADAEIGIPDQRRIIKVLTGLGWNRRKSDNIRFYERPEKITTPTGQSGHSDLEF
jgi:predicted P-loop ATPase